MDVIQFPEFVVVPGLSTKVEVVTDSSDEVVKMDYTPDYEHEPESILEGNEPVYDEQLGDNVNIGYGTFIPRPGYLGNPQELDISVAKQQNSDTIYVYSRAGSEISNISIDGRGAYAYIKVGESFTVTWNIGGDTRRPYNCTWDISGSEVDITDQITIVPNGSSGFLASVTLTVDENPDNWLTNLYIRTQEATQASFDVNINHGTWEVDAFPTMCVGDTVKFTFTPDSGYICSSITYNGSTIPMDVNSQGVGTVELTISSYSNTLNVTCTSKVAANIWNHTGAIVDFIPATPIVGLPCDVMVEPTDSSKMCTSILNNGNNILQSTDESGVGMGSFVPVSVRNELTATFENKPAPCPISFIFKMMDDGSEIDPQDYGIRVDVDEKSVSIYDEYKLDSEHEVRIILDLEYVLDSVEVIDNQNNTSEIIKLNKCRKGAEFRYEFSAIANPYMEYKVFVHAYDYAPSMIFRTRDEGDVVENVKEGEVFGRSFGKMVSEDKIPVWGWAFVFINRDWREAYDPSLSSHWTFFGEGEPYPDCILSTALLYMNLAQDYDQSCAWLLTNFDPRRKVIGEKYTVYPYFNKINRNIHMGDHVQIVFDGLFLNNKNPHVINAESTVGVFEKDHTTSFLKESYHINELPSPLYPEGWRSLSVIDIDIPSLMEIDAMIEDGNVPHWLETLLEHHHGCLELPFWSFVFDRIDSQYYEEIGDLKIVTTSSAIRTIRSKEMELID